MKAKVDARNKLETYIYNMKSTGVGGDYWPYTSQHCYPHRSSNLGVVSPRLLLSAVEDKMKDKMEEDDKEKISDALKEAQEWLDENGDAGETRRLRCGACAAVRSV